MELTDRAEALWASYESEVRRRLADRGDVDVADVLAGVREHVEAELSRRGVETVTGEDLSDVLAQVGGPGQWDDAVADAAVGSPRPGGSLPGGESAAGPGALPAPPRWPGMAALLFTLLGAVLILLGFWWSWAPGWGLVAAGVVLARVSLEHDDPESSGIDARPGPTRRLTLTIWWVASAVGTLAVVVLPAVLVWGAAQIGGPLEAVLPGRPGVPGSPAPLPGYWRLPVLIGGSATAVWWMLLAALAVRFGDGIRRLLGPARALAPEAAPRALTVGVGVLILASLIFGVLS